MIWGKHSMKFIIEITESNVFFTGEPLAALIKCPVCLSWVRRIAEERSNTSYFNTRPQVYDISCPSVKHDLATERYYTLYTVYMFDTKQPSSSRYHLSFNILLQYLWGWRSVCMRVCLCVCISPCSELVCSMCGAGWGGWERILNLLSSVVDRRWACRSYF